MSVSASQIIGFNIQPQTTVGLTLGIDGGEILLGGQFRAFQSQTVMLPASATNFVEIGTDGIAVVKTLFTAGKNPLFVVVTTATGITSFADWRFQPAAALAATVSGGAVAATGSSQSTPFGFTTAAQADGIVTLVNNIRTALVASGQMT